MIGLTPSCPRTSHVTTPACSSTTPVIAQDGKIKLDELLDYLRKEVKVALKAPPDSDSQPMSFFLTSRVPS